MTETVRDGGNAFPACNEANVNGTMGMSLRDWFAGQALAGEMAGDDLGDGPIALRSNENAKLMAERAYHMADAMLSARAIGAKP